MREINRSLTRIEAKDSYYSGNFGRSFRLTEAMAYEGDVKSEYTLGYMYYYGIGAPENKPLGIAWIKEAAIRGYPPAVFALKKLVREPGFSEIERPSSIAKAQPKPQPIMQEITAKPPKDELPSRVQEVSVLALQGDAASQYMLGYMYYYGKGIPQNKSLGISLIKQAAEKGHTSAVIALKKLEDFNQNVMVENNTDSLKTIQVSANQNKIRSSDEKKMSDTISTVKKEQFLSLIQPQEIEKKVSLEEARTDFLSLLSSPEKVKFDRKAQFMALIQSQTPVKKLAKTPVKIQKIKQAEVTLNLLSFLDDKEIKEPQEMDPNWVLQLGTFVNPMNAQSLVKKLQEKGYNAYTNQTKQKDKVFTCVFTKSKSKSVDQIKEELESQFKLKDVIVLNKVKQPTEKLILLAAI